MGKQRVVLKNDAGTYYQHAASEADVPRGRFTAHEKSNVIGSSETVAYPQLPGSSPWARDPVPDEPPIDADLSAPIVGEVHEVLASLAAVSDGTAASAGPSPNPPGGGRVQGRSTRPRRSNRPGGKR